MAYSRFSNDRARQFCIRTDIGETGDGKKYVRKFAANEAAYGHIHQLAENCKVFTAQFAGSSLQVNQLAEKRDVQGQRFVEAEYLENTRTLEELLDECLQKQDEVKFTALFDRYLSVLDYAKGGNLQDFDLIFPNIMVQEDIWTVIDYEWISQKMTAEEMAQRALFCYVLENEKRKDSPILQKVLAQLGMDEDAFGKLLSKEQDFQQRILTETDGTSRTVVTDLRHMIGHMAVPAKEFFNLADRKKVQIFEDYGAGYSPEHSYYIHNVFEGDNWIRAEIDCPDDVRAIRLDPAEEPCMVRLKQVIYNGRILTKEQLERAIVTNGQPLAGEKGVASSVLFDTNDPNINVRLEVLKDTKVAGTFGKLVIEAHISWLSAEMLADLKAHLTRRKHRWFLK